MSAVPEDEAPEVPRPRRARASSAAAPSAPEAPRREFNGKRVPHRTTHYKCVSATSGETLSSGATAAGIQIDEWPIEELTDERITERFPPGQYQLRWIDNNGKKGRQILGNSPVFTIVAPPRTAAPASAAPEPGSFSCCGNLWKPPLRFCAICGANAQGARTALERVNDQAPGTELMRGFEMALRIIGTVRDAEAGETQRKIEAERQAHELRMKRQEQEFEMDLAQTRARHERALREEGRPVAVDADAIARTVSAGLKAQLEEMRDDIDAVADEAEESAKKVESTMGTIANLAKEYAPIVVPHLVSLVQAAVTKAPPAPAAPRLAAVE